jgi:hypothetical protein
MLAACLAAAAALGDRSRTALAADGNALTIGGANIGTNQTILFRTSGAGNAFIVADHAGAAGAIIGVISGDAPKSGVLGLNPGAGYGLHGITTTGAGGFAESLTSGVGVQGRSVTGTGVVGSSNGNVVLSEGQEPTTAFAAQFLGGHGVFIDGDLQVSGQKSAVVPYTDGTLRRVYCMEGPEALFEDVGEGTLSNGAATVSLDNDFGPIIKRNRYQVFLTPYGECRGLAVTSRTPQGFTVTELGAGKSNVRFGYRIVAPRRDAPEMRLPKSVRPKVPNPRVPTVEEVRRQVPRQ